MFHIGWIRSEGYWRKEQKTRDRLWKHSLNFFAEKLCVLQAQETVCAETWKLDESVLTVTFCNQHKFPV